MKKIFPFFAIMLMLLIITLMGYSSAAYAQEQASPTPTYDPLDEPLVPENPTAYELGRNWYWHYCMPCHGDKGQGLTDEWRAVWEPDHQDCWGKGCHAGERIEDSFFIPTVVPPVVSSAKLASFSSLEALSGYLKTTHPPQNPGWLQDEQYRAIALYVFSENDRQLVEPTPTNTPTPPIPTSTLLPETAPVEESPGRPNFNLYIGLGIVLFVLVLWGLLRRR